MVMAVKISLLFSGIFLLTGMLTGIWKYAKIMSSPAHRAPTYVDIAHRSALLYSFASLVIAKLVEYSPFDPVLQMVIVTVPLLFFALTVIGYVKEGSRNERDNMFTERNFITTWFMYGLIAGEVGGVSLLLGGFIYTQFFV